MSLLEAYRGLLRNPRIARLLFGEFVSSIGDWLYLVALLIVVYRESTDPILLGIVGAARVLPYVFLSVPAGIVADRFDRRLVLLATDVARGAIMLVLAALVAFGGPLWAIVALAVLATCFSSFFGPTIGAFLPTLVNDESELGPANSAWSSLDNLAFVIGPAIAGLLIAAGGLTLAFLLNAVSFAVVALVLWRLPAGRPRQEGPADEPAIGDGPGEAPTASGSAAGATEAGRSAAPATPRPVLRALARPLAGLALVDVVGGFVYGGLGILTVILATDVYGSGDAATGYLNAAIGVGGVVGAVASGALVLRPRLGPALVLGAIGLATGLAVLGATEALAVALVAMTVASAGDLVLEVVSTTLFQRIVPDAIRGRALGALTTVGMLSYSAGSFLLPVVAGSVGIPAVLAASGAAVVAAAAVGVVLVGPVAVRPTDRHAEVLRRVARLPIFAGVPPARLEVALARLVEVPVADGTTVIRQGDPADRFYLIAEGSFEVTRREPDDPPDAPARALRRMGPDEVFGEIGLLTGAARTATVTAASGGLLLALDGPDFLELVSAGPGLATRLLDLHRGAASEARAMRTTPAVSES